MKNGNIYRLLIVLIIAVFILTVGSTAFALQDNFFNTESEEAQVQEFSLFSLIIIIAGSFIVFAIMVTSVVAEVRKRNKK